MIQLVLHEQHCIVGLGAGSWVVWTRPKTQCAPTQGTEIQRGGNRVVWVTLLPKAHGQG
jgi:hypothetical protein